MSEEVIVVHTPINPVVVRGATAFSAEHARIWAEGTDQEVENLGGEHSAKGWAESAEEGSHEYTDQQIALAKEELTNNMNIAVDGAVNTAKAYTNTEVNSETLARQQAVSNEAATRSQADNDLQSQIDAIAAASDVTDIVGTYADLQSYDTSKLKDNDIIKVLTDSTHNNASSYYRWDKESSSFSYIGSEGPYYTKSETDSTFLTQANAASTYATQSSLTSGLASKASSADGTTIIDNSSTISTVAIKEQRANTAIKKWVGTKEQYEAIITKDDNTQYIITNDTDAWVSIDTEISSTSENPVQNQAIYQALQNIDALPSQTGQAGKFLTTDGTNASWANATAAADNTTIVTNLNDTISTVAVKEQRVGTAIKQWVGTKQQYESILEKDSDTLYNVTDGSVEDVADTNLSNITNTGKSTSAAWSFPSTVSTALTLGSSGTEYTAPANGYVVLAVTSGLSYFYLVNTTTGLASGVTNAGAGYTCRLFIPVQKDDKFEVDYQLTPDAYSFAFIYAEGSKTEA